MYGDQTWGAAAHAAHLDPVLAAQERLTAAVFANFRAMAAERVELPRTLKDLKRRG